MILLTQRMTVVRGLFFAVLGAGLPVSASAHVKWFAEPGADHFFHSFTRMEIGFSIALLMLGIVVAKYLSNYCLKQGGVLSGQLTLSSVPLRVFQFLLAFYLMGCVFSGNILVPHVDTHIAITIVGLAIQSFVAVALVLKRYLVAASLLFYVLFLIVGVIEHSFLVEYLLLAGIAWIVFSRNTVPTEFSLMLLRITLGVSLIALALTEKLLQPELAFNVLAQHPLNFMPHLGFNFSDGWFVLGAGMVELFIGLLFVLGLMVRTTTLVILGLMIASNSYFFWIDNYELAMMELVGHLPVFAAGVLLVFYYGKTYSSRADEVAAPKALANEANLLPGS